MNLLEYLLSFSIFILLQGLFINGANACFKEGMIFYKIGERLKKYWWSSPAFKCIRCMASAWSVITFVPLFLSLFGFHWIMFPILVFDAFILVTVNYWIYKRS